MNERPPRRTNGNSGFSTEPWIRLQAGRARVAAARGIDIWRNVLRFIVGGPEPQIYRIFFNGSALIRSMIRTIRGPEYAVGFRAQGVEFLL